MMKRRLKKDENSLILDKRPSFFKIIHEGLTTEYMRIPPQFIKYIKDEEPQSAVLKVPSGAHWHIENGCGRFKVSNAKTPQESALSKGKRERGRPRKYPVGTLKDDQLNSCLKSPDQSPPCCNTSKCKCFNVRDFQIKVESEETDLPMLKINSKAKKVGEKFQPRK